MIADVRITGGRKVHQGGQVNGVVGKTKKAVIAEAERLFRQEAKLPRSANAVGVIVQERDKWLRGKPEVIVNGRGHL